MEEEVDDECTAHFTDVVVLGTDEDFRPCELVSCCSCCINVHKNEAGIEVRLRVVPEQVKISDC